MPVNVKSKNTTKDLAQIGDIGKTVAQWSRNNSDGSFSVDNVQAIKLQSGIAWIHCAAKVTKAMTKGAQIWLGSLPADFLPLWNIYGFEVAHGALEFKANASTGKADITLIPNRDLTVGMYTYFDLTYFTR